MRRCIIICAALLLTGCGIDLETEYAANDARLGSVNGITVFTAGIEADWDLRRMWMLGERLDASDIGCIVHVARTAGAPTADGQRWLRGWLEAQDGRQAVVVLRDGNVAPFLCRRWADEARAEAVRVGPPMDAGLEGLATRLDARAVDEDDPQAFIRGSATSAAPAIETDAIEADDRPLLGIAVLPAIRRPVAAVAGLGLTTAPATLTIGAVPACVGLRTVVQAVPKTGAPQPLIAELLFGKSRLVVVANATALVDGAMPDPEARRLLAALRGDLVRFRDAHHGSRGAALVGRLAERHGDDERMDMLGLLFGKPPISWVAWHLLAVLAVFLLWKGRHLGRREALDERHLDRFERHVEALAGHLRDQQAARQAADAIARWRGLTAAPPANRDAGAQAAWLDERTHDATTHRTPPP